MSDIAVEVLMFIGGLYFYGFRNMIGKWLVHRTMQCIHKRFIKTERDITIYWHYYYEKKRALNSKKSK